MKILVACEYSGRVRRAFSALGHDVLSADFEPAEDGSPYHYQGECKDELYQLLDAISETDAEYVSLILDRLENER